MDPNSYWKARAFSFIRIHYFSFYVELPNSNSSSHSYHYPPNYSGVSSTSEKRKLVAL